MRTLFALSITLCFFLSACSDSSSAPKVARDSVSSASTTNGYGDTPDTASTITLPEFDSRLIYSGDYDYMRFTASASGTLAGLLTYDSTGSDLDMLVYEVIADSPLEIELLAEKEMVSDSETIYCPVTGSTDYIVCIYDKGPGASVDYDIDLQLVTPDVLLDPSINSITAQTGNVGDPIDFQASGSSVSGEHYFCLAITPNNVVFDSSDGDLEWTPTWNNYGLYELVVGIVDVDDLNNHVFPARVAWTTVDVDIDDEGNPGESNATAISAGVEVEAEVGSQDVDHFSFTSTADEVPVVHVENTSGGDGVLEVRFARVIPGGGSPDTYEQVMYRTSEAGELVELWDAPTVGTTTDYIVTVAPRSAESDSSNVTYDLVYGSVVSSGAISIAELSSVSTSEGEIYEADLTSTGSSGSDILSYDATGVPGFVDVDSSSGHLWYAINGSDFDGSYVMTIKVTNHGSSRTFGSLGDWDWEDVSFSISDDADYSRLAARRGLVAPFYAENGYSGNTRDSYSEIDIDQDSDLDLIWMDAMASTLSWALWNASSEEYEIVDEVSIDHLSEYEIQDVDQDGTQDICVVAGTNGNEILVSYGQSTSPYFGSFSSIIGSLEGFVKLKAVELVATEGESFIGVDMYDDKIVVADAGNSYAITRISITGTPVDVIELDGLTTNRSAVVFTRDPSSVLRVEKSGGTISAVDITSSFSGYSSMSNIASVIPWRQNTSDTGSAVDVLVLEDNAANGFDLTVLYRSSGSSFSAVSGGSLPHSTSRIFPCDTNSDGVTDIGLEYNYGIFPRWSAIGAVMEGSTIDAYAGGVSELSPQDAINSALQSNEETKKEKKGPEPISHIDYFAGKGWKKDDIVKVQHHDNPSTPTEELENTFHEKICCALEYLSNFAGQIANDVSDSDPDDQLAKNIKAVADKGLLLKNKCVIFIGNTPPSGTAGQARIPSDGGPAIILDNSLNCKAGDTKADWEKWGAADAKWMKFVKTLLHELVHIVGPKGDCTESKGEVATNASEIAYAHLLKKYRSKHRQHSSATSGQGNDVSDSDVNWSKWNDKFYQVYSVRSKRIRHALKSICILSNDGKIDEEHKKFSSALLKLLVCTIMDEFSGSETGYEKPDELEITEIIPSYKAEKGYHRVGDTGDWCPTKETVTMFVTVRMNLKFCDKEQSVPLSDVSFSEKCEVCSKDCREGEKESSKPAGKEIPIKDGEGNVTSMVVVKEITVPQNKGLSTDPVKIEGTKKP